MIKQKIAELIEYAKQFLYLEKDDEIYVENLVCGELGVADGLFEGEIDKNLISKLEDANSILQPIYEYAVANEIARNQNEDMFKTKIMGLITPLPSKINKMFAEIEKKEGIDKACQFFYNLCIKSDYIKLSAIRKNILFIEQFDNNQIEITINLSKPEKDNAEIARLAKLKSVDFPKCMLCESNIGYRGRENFPARQTLRFVPVEIFDEEWFMQFSPYSYYEEHCIVISKQHKPMNVDCKTIAKLAEFVERFDNYFVGSNASLPIIGGSILSHEHFQGGKHLMPLQNSPCKKTISVGNYNVQACIVDWFNSTIRITGCKNDVVNAGCNVLEKWMNYSDESVDIISRTDSQHNGITPIMRKENGKFILDLILRNNRTSEEHPEGIFHAHKQFMNIKKEGIGLIEAMGLFILPARLKTELEAVGEILMGSLVKTPDDFKENDMLFKHRFMIDELIKTHGLNLSSEVSQKAIEKYVANVCKSILECTAVFKNNEKGEKAFDKFIATLNI